MGKPAIKAEESRENIKPTRAAKLRETQRKFKVNESDLGPSDSLRHTVLSLVIAEQYDRAVSELNAYIDMKIDFTQFRMRSSRYVGHATDLIFAIRSKRSFPGMNSLSTAKQQDLLDRSLQHFEELKQTLKRVEQIEHELRLDDVRSTVWVVRAITNSIFAVMVVYFILQLSHGMIGPLSHLGNDILTKVADFVCSKLGL